jgi:hypothetical protein
MEATEGKVRDVKSAKPAIPDSVLGGAGSTTYGGAAGAGGAPAYGGAGAGGAPVYGGGQAAGAPPQQPPAYGGGAPGAAGGQSAYFSSAAAATQQGAGTLQGVEARLQRLEGVLAGQGEVLARLSNRLEAMRFPASPAGGGALASSAEVVALSQQLTGLRTALDTGLAALTSDVRASSGAIGKVHTRLSDTEEAMVRQAASTRDHVDRHMGRWGWNLYAILGLLVLAGAVLYAARAWSRPAPSHSHRFL